MINYFIIAIGKLISFISRILNLGSGSTWPGEIGLFFNKDFIKDLLNKNKNLKTVLIAGTNGKTTTAKLIKTMLEKNGKRVFQNQSGANLLNGIASSMLLQSSILSKINFDYAVFEVDENSLPLVLNDLTPNYLILLNLFRDQLDRYGEVDAIAQKWNKSVKKNNIVLILNADDPQIAWLGQHMKNVYYFGLDDIRLSQKHYQHASDSNYCPNCNSRLIYKTVYFSHLGDWQCDNCGYKRPNLAGEGKLTTATFQNLRLHGVYNKYNLSAAVLFAKLNNINNETIEQSVKSFLPAFGRQEIIKINSKKVQIFLSKNPTSFNESLRTVKYLGAKYILFVLNDRIPDGRDVSWIWDVDFEDYIDTSINVSVAGDRAFDMALRLKYALKTQNAILKQFSSVTIEDNLKRAIKVALEKTPKSETLYILPTYSAMLEVRKILTGKKIL